MARLVELSLWGLESLLQMLRLLGRTEHWGNMTKWGINWVQGLMPIQLALWLFELD